MERFGATGHALSNAIIAFHQAVADQLGLHVTDHKALGILWAQGPMSAGRLGELLGLTTGAVTAVIDRLDRAGYVERRQDPADRRRVIVAPRHDPARDAEIQALFEPMERAFAQHLPDYNDAERQLILDFVEHAITALREATAEVRERRQP